MTDIKMLPLPEVLIGRGKAAAEAWCRAVAEHNVAARDAEIEALRAEVGRLTSCLATANANHETFERRWYLERDRTERLEDALRKAIYYLEG